MLLRVENLNKHFGGLHAVNNISFEVKKGIIKAIIGPNGAGKTTVFNLIAGVLFPSSGKVFFKEDDITGLKPYQIAQKGLIRTFQNLKLCNHMTVLENVMIGRHIKSKSSFFTDLFSLSLSKSEYKKIKDKSKEILKLVGLEDKSEILVSNLPFGQRRLVELARALAAEPELLLLDEPAAGLNMKETEELSELLVKIKEWGITILIVEHDMSLVMGISDEVFVLNFGKAVAEGKPDEIQRNKEVIKIYLGEEYA